MLVTVSRRAPVMMVEQRGATGTLKGVRMMIVSAAGKPNLKGTSRFAYAAGATGILANLFFIILYVLLGLQANQPGGGTSLGPAGELAGSARTCSDRFRRRL
ncbi:MAG TPA: hypothetical protein VE691_10110 [Rubrobacter sp.]|nr:hypothetical protein [Rubrobacter sp.]